MRPQYLLSAVLLAGACMQGRAQSSDTLPTDPGSDVSDSSSWVPVTAAITPGSFHALRSRVHLSAGSTDVVPELPQQISGEKPVPTGWGYDVAVRVKGNWLVGAAYTRTGTSGATWRSDSSMTYTPAGSGLDPLFTPIIEAFFGPQQPSGPVTLLWGDAVTITHRSDAYELMGGYELFRERERPRLVYLTGRVIGGLRLLHMQEVHEHYPNMPRYAGQRQLLAPHVQAQTNTTAWAATLRFRGDVHVTRFFSGFAELLVQFPFGDPRMPATSGTINGETSVLRERNIELSGAAVRGGVALHF